MDWTDRFQHIKIAFLVSAVFIAVASLVVSHFLINDLADEERSRMSVWAEAMHSLNHADENTDLNLVLKVINENNSIPVIVLDIRGRAQLFRNVKLDADNHKDSIDCASEMGRSMRMAGNVIRVALSENDKSDYIDVCYAESTVLQELTYYPYVQLGLVTLFVVIAAISLLIAKKAEQNNLWVGLSKETAHQLGTPISSLMAWVEILKDNHPDDELIDEMGKDVTRLELIAERFSKIGSLPESVSVSIVEVLNRVTDYMDRRTSKKIIINKVFPSEDITVRMNASLFEWVIENLCKNAVDAMKGEGNITIMVSELSGKVVIEVADTGKGIRKKDLKNVFKPGFTTKKRGWGLGLSLAKRIIEEYHKGKIYVKKSNPDAGTVFHIELSK